MNKLINFAQKIASKIPVIGKYFTDEIIRFLIIGTCAFLINFAIYQTSIRILEAIFDTNNDILRALMVGLPFLFAYFIAYLFNFTMSKKWTFKDQSPKKGVQAMKFLLVNTFNALGGSGFIALLDYFGIRPIISQPIFVAMEAFWSYLLYKFWVFKKSTK
jgi:putative flippase GtrA